MPSARRSQGEAAIPPLTRFRIRIILNIVMAVQRKAPGVVGQQTNMTRQREVVLQVVTDAEHHPTAAEAHPLQARKYSSHARRPLPRLSLGLGRGAAGNHALIDAAMWFAARDSNSH